MTIRDWGVFTLHCGDNRDVLRSMPDSSVDSVVCDPPYGLTSARPTGRSAATEGAVMKGFMGLAWDGAVPGADTWAEVLRVLKPGGHLLAFFGTRTYHRGVAQVEDAGFEIRDQIMWVFGSGFPKSHNGEWGGTALKPAHEPIVMARKPLAGTVAVNYGEYGTGALNIDGCRVGGGVDEMRGRSGTAGRWPANLIHDGSDEVLAAFPNAPGQIADASSSSSPRENQNAYGAMRRGNGRDGEPSADSENEGAVGFRMKPGARRNDAGSAARFFYCSKASRTDRNEGLDGLPSRLIGTWGGDDDLSAGKSSTLPRANTHPTVKPTDLMRYLCRMVTPAGGIVLDPFMGSGSTGKAAVLEGFRFIGIELDPQYVEIAERRIATAIFGPAAVAA